MSRRGPESPPFHSGPPPTYVRESGRRPGRQGRTERPPARPAQPGPITALREHPRRAGRYVVEVGGGVVAPVSVEMVSELALRVGAALDATALARVEEGARSVACYDQALDALARRSRSRRGLERWLLEREHAREAIGVALDRLEGLGMLDDAAFARGYARTRLGGRGFGPRRVAAELARHGVARGTVDAVLAEVAAEREGEVPGDAGAASDVEVVAMKRARALSGLEPAVAERRLVGWLVRRGFGVGEAMRAARAALRAE